MRLLNRQGQVQGEQGEGGGAAAADQQAGGDQRLPRGRRGVRKAEVSLLNQGAEKDFDSRAAADVSSPCCLFTRQWASGSKEVFIKANSKGLDLQIMVILEIRLNLLAASQTIDPV